MDESVAQSPEQQIITRASVTSAIPTTDHNDAKLFYRPTETPCAPTGASIPSVLKQVKHVDTEIEGRGPGQQSAIDQQHITKDFLISSKNSKPASIISTSIVPIDENPPYKCNRCSESFHYMCELDYHAKQHSGKTFHSYTDLLYHKHPGDEDKESITTTAPTANSLRKDLNQSIYSNVRLNPYICQYCSKSYPNTYHMYGHRGEKILNPRVSRYLMARTENSYIIPGP
uniref:C2H2-type domain-containing protein n=1 Tax=Wuchereria bancrofti TaxID=6293 RepID=A0AAF5PKT0_WUCBA